VFQVGPLELGVLALVAIIVIGPEKLPGLARDAANLIRTLRDLATGARQQLKEELGPEFADLDLRNLNPRTAVQRAVFGDDVDLGRLNPRNALRDAIFGDEDVRAADPRTVIRETGEDVRRSTRAAFYGDTADDSVVSMSKDAAPSTVKPSMVKPTSIPSDSIARPRPRPRPASSTPYDADAT
jgi:sec-independent protein translocase protein TatB